MAVLVLVVPIHLGDRAPPLATLSICRSAPPRQAPPPATLPICRSAKRTPPQTRQQSSSWVPDPSEAFRIAVTNGCFKKN